ncbi:PAS domain S-box protein [Desulfurispira natronophila]|uniref:Sensor protein FixL n=1 Tax=Desulfurispira natronophila TaxID=682562 RepID=A0A7W7Y5J0_9BACT|nr:PAS domain S-box protein [Desulfurispira natronophila]MBB5022498.1 PAS domain S-box-containing protein [Desulfurispira natronophila]
MQPQHLIQLLHAINRAQSTFLATSDPHQAFGQLLQDVLELTASEYGFIGEVHYDENDTPYLKSHAITNIAWDDATRKFYEESAQEGLVFTNLRTLFGAALTTQEPVIANDPAHDSRRGGLPEGHPAMNAFLGLPIKRGESLVAMVGLANRPHGYDQALVEFLEPLLSTIGQLIEARRIEQARLQAQAELKDNQTLLNMVLEASGDGMWDLNMVTGHLHWSDASFTMLGYEPQQFPLDFATWEKLIHPDDLKSVKEKMETAVSSGDNLNIDFRYRTQSGAWQWTQGRGRVVQRDSSGVPLRMVGVHSDISKRRIADDRLRESENRYRSVINALGEGVVMQAASGEILTCNDAAEEILGLNRQQMMGRTSIDPRWKGIREDGSDFPGHEHPSMRCLESGQSQRGVIMGVHKPDGNLTWILINAEPVWDKDNEKPVAVVTSFTDITQRKQMEQDLRDREHRLELATSSANLGIWDLDLESGHLEWNYMMFHLYGIDPKDFNHTVETWQHALHPEDRQRTEDEINRAIADGSTFNSEFRIIRPDGDIVHIQATAQVICEGGKACRIIGINMDTTEQKQSEKLLKQSEKMFRDLFDLSPVAVIINRLSDGAFLEGNQALYDMTGYDAKQLGSLSYWDITPRRYEQQEMEQLETLRTRGFYGPFEKEYIHKDGSLIPVLLNGRLFDFNGEECIYSVVQDITPIRDAQEALSESEHRFRSLFELYPDASLLIDTQTGLPVQFNSVAHEQLGYTAEEFANLTISDYEIIETPEETAAHIEKIITEGRDDFETQHRRKDGSIIDISVTVLRIDLSGHIYFLCVFRDITSQKEASQALEQSEQRFRDVAAAAGEYIWETDTAGNYSFLTKPIEEILGQPVESILGRTPFDFIPAAEQQRVGDFFRNAASRQEAFRGLEHRSLHADGHIVWQLVSGLPTFDAKGNLKGYRGVALDITRQKEAEASLTAYAKHTQAILDNVVDGIITIDELGYIQSFNRSAERIFGYKASEILAEKINTIMPPPHNQCHDNYLKAYQQTGVKHVIDSTRELEGRHCDGTLFPIELSVTEIFQDSKTVYVGMVRDITERKRIDRMKNEFVSTVSHELRTPLTSISGSLGLILGTAGDGLSTQVKEMLALAYRNSQRLSNLINDLLDMEKIAAGKMRFDMQVQKLMPLVEQAIESNRSYAQQYNVEYRLVERQDGVSVSVDGERLVQVLSNFLSNGAKFSPAGSVVEVGVITDQDMVRVEVRDQGPGIPAEFLPRLFTKFSQADSSDTRKKGGTGLGLAISKEISEQMNAGVGVEPREGGGSIFYAELPIHRENEQS